MKEQNRGEWNTNDERQNKQSGRFDFSEEFGKIDDELITKAGEPWTKGKKHVLQLYRRKIAAAAVILLAGIAAAGNPHVQAAVQQFTTKIGEILGFHKDLEPYTEVIGQTQTQGDISLTLNEVILDDHTLIVSLLGDFGDRKKSPYLWISEEKTTINGKKAWPYSVGVAGNADLEAVEEYGMDRDMVLTQKYENLELPEDDVKVHLVVDAGKWNYDDFLAGAVEGEFVYDFVFSQEELNAQTVKKELDIPISWEDAGEVILTDVTMNDLSCRINVDGLTQDDRLKNDYELKLKGEDSFGNPVSLFSGVYMSGGTFFETSFYGDYESGEMADEDTFEMGIPDKNCAYLDLQLYKRKRIMDPESEEDLDEEYAVGEFLDSSEAYADDENYGWEPVGKKFRINMK